MKTVAQPKPPHDVEEFFKVLTSVCSTGFTIFSRVQDLPDQLGGGPAHGPLEPGHHMPDLCVLLHRIESLLYLCVPVHKEVVE